MIVCLDTNAFLWGIRGHYDPADEPRAQQAKRMISRLRKTNLEVLIPSCVMSEALSIFPEGEARTLLLKYAEKYHIGHMDTAVTFHLSRLLHHHYNVNREAWEGLGISKRHLKYDALIVATAIGHEASAIFTHDKGVRTTAAGKIEVCGLDDMPKGFDKAVVDAQPDTEEDKTPF